MRRLMSWFAMLVYVGEQRPVAIRSRDMLLATVDDNPEGPAAPIDGFAPVGGQLVHPFHEGAWSDDVKAIRVVISDACEIGAWAPDSLCQSLAQDCETQSLNDVEPRINRIDSAFLDSKGVHAAQRLDGA